MVAEDRNVMHALEGMVKGYFRENPFHQQQLKIFGKGNPVVQVGLLCHQEILWFITTSKIKAQHMILENMLYP